MSTTDRDDFSGPGPAGVGDYYTDPQATQRLFISLISQIFVYSFPKINCKFSIASRARIFSRSWEPATPTPRRARAGARLGKARRSGVRGGADGKDSCVCLWYCGLLRLIAAYCGLLLIVRTRACVAKDSCVCLWYCGLLRLIAAYCGLLLIVRTRACVAKDSCVCLWYCGLLRLIAAYCGLFGLLRLIAYCKDSCVCLWRTSPSRTCACVAR